MVKDQDEKINSKYKKREKSNNYQIPLCKFCYSRNFTKSNTILNVYKTDIKIIKSTKKICFICKNFFWLVLPSIIDKILSCEVFSTNQCEYKINIGTRLPVFFYENEDYIRSMFQIRGKHHIKNQINSIIRKSIIDGTKCKIEYFYPEFKFDIVIDDDLRYVVNYKAREFYLLGKYNKLRRGIFQKNSNKEENVNSKLKDSNQREIEISVEEFIKKSIFLDYRTEDLKITWTGSEDKESLVLGNGRPFIVKVRNPKFNIVKNQHFLYNGIGLYFRKINYEDIEKYYRYKLFVIILIRSEVSFNDRRDLERLIQTLSGEIRFRVKNKSVRRNIYRSELKKVEENCLELLLELDNGIPIKQLVGGIQPIDPCLSKILRSKCECIYFDIQDVILNS